MNSDRLLTVRGLASKADGSLRCCGDYKRINAVTVSDSYPIPHIHDFILFKNRFGKSVPSDLSKSRRHFRLFEYVRMPFGFEPSKDSSVTSSHRFLLRMHT